MDIHVLHCAHSCSPPLAAALCTGRDTKRRLASTSGWAGRPLLRRFMPLRSSLLVRDQIL
jgi:hypothetical protein